MSYKIEAYFEGAALHIEETFTHRFFTFRAAKYALKKGMVVRLTKVDRKELEGMK
jgi:hypothetical protein